MNAPQEHTRLQSALDAFSQGADLFPVASAVLDEHGRVVNYNRDFARLFEIDPVENSLATGVLLGEDGYDYLKKYLVQSHPEGIVLNVKTTSGRIKHVKIVSRPVPVQAAVGYFAIFFDFSQVKNSSVYFEQSFDQFMNATIDLEEALKLIETQKSEIEKINQELQQINASMKRDLRLAEILQNELMPHTPVSDKWAISYLFKPMAGVSGDIFDFYQFKDSDNIGVLLLDASGHGVSSALITVIARPIFFRSHRKFVNGRLNQAMESANRLLCDQIGQVSNYLTGVSVRLYDDCLKFVNAGHPYIHYYRRRSHKIYELENDGSLLGIPEMRMNYRTRRVMVEPGDVFVLFTDGLTEAHNPDGAEFGEAGIRRALLKVPVSAGPTAIIQQIQADLEEMGVDENRLHDDMTVIVLKKL